MNAADVVRQTHRAARAVEARRIAGGIAACCVRLREAFGPDAARVALVWAERDRDAFYASVATRLLEGDGVVATTATESGGAAR